MTTAEEFARLLASDEAERVEFKTAENRFDFEELVEYCVALANAGGGKVVLGVSNARPRKVVGTRAFSEPGRTAAGVEQRIHHRVRIEEYEHDGKRLLIVHVPGRALGEAWHINGRFLRRVGDALLPMTDAELRAIHAEGAPDYSAMTCDAGLGDLAPAAVATFKALWDRRSPELRVATWSDGELLRNAELTEGARPTIAALVLLGSGEALGRHLANAEVVFEYRSGEGAGPAQDREDFREGFLLLQERLWNRINIRNDRQSIQDGFFRTDILTFDEKVIREAILNAVAHRDYREPGSVFIRQYARRLEVQSPGGFPRGVTPENVLDAQNPRNRRLCEALMKCGLVDRAGTGVNMMFERSIQQSKAVPDFMGSGPGQVQVTLHGLVTNPAFLRYLEKVGAETMQAFSTADFMALDHLQRGGRVPEFLRARLPRLVELGVIESVGRGRGVRYLLSRSLHAAIGRRGEYTRRRGLDHETNRQLLLKHLRENPGGSPLSDLVQVLPGLGDRSVQRLLAGLREDGLAELKGARRWARWFAKNQGRNIGS